MRRADFSYQLPAELIADRPLPRRGASRLLGLDGATGALADLRFSRPRLAAAARRPARAERHARAAGAAVTAARTAAAPARSCSSASSTTAPRPGAGAREQGAEARTRASCCPPAPRPSRSRDAGDLFELEFDRAGAAVFRGARQRAAAAVRGARGRTPDDRERYQTVYARGAGRRRRADGGPALRRARLLAELARARRRHRAAVTLHVGAGTFHAAARRRYRRAPHARRAHPRAAAPASPRSRRARARGGRVVAVGTTVVRALESAAADGGLQAVRGRDRHLHPARATASAWSMRCSTNFHLPESTLLMLVSAFAGRERVLAAYHHAVDSALPVLQLRGCHVRDARPAALDAKARPP